MIIFQFCFLLSFGFDGEDISNSQDIVFNHISKHLRARSKHSATHCIFTSVLGIWKSGRLPCSFVFDRLLTTPPQLDFHPVNCFFFPVGGWAGEKSLESMHSTSTQCRMPCSKGFLHWYKLILVYLLTFYLNVLTDMLTVPNRLYVKLLSMKILMQRYC